MRKEEKMHNPPENLEIKLDEYVPDGAPTFSNGETEVVYDIEGEQHVEWVNIEEYS